jgi:hypothetical protein
LSPCSSWEAFSLLRALTRERSGPFFRRARPPRRTWTSRAS